MFQRLVVRSFSLARRSPRVTHLRSFSESSRKDDEQKGGKQQQKIRPPYQQQQPPPQKPYQPPSSSSSAPPSDAPPSGQSSTPSFQAGVRPRTAKGRVTELVKQLYEKGAKGKEANKVQDQLQKFNDFLKAHEQFDMRTSLSSARTPLAEKKKSYSILSHKK